MIRKYSVLVILIVSLLLISCGKKDFSIYFEPESETEIVNTGTHQWYAFTNDNFVKIDRPEVAIAFPFIPWTESIRISSSTYSDKCSFAIVNRLGILTFDGDKISLSKDLTVFSNRTAGNLFLIDGVPMFSVYKSSFFNDSIKTPEYKFDKSQHFFLVQYDLKSKICYPVVNCNNLIEPPESEVVDYVWDGLNWICNIKTISDSKIKFSYLTWKPTATLSSLTPVESENKISVTESDKDTFRDAKEVLDFSKVPESVEKLLNGVSSKVPFTVEVKNYEGGSSKTYRNKTGSNKLVELKSKAFIAENWAGALFEDGTFYFEGYLPGKHILRGGKPVVLRLPKLPAGYAYTDFTISGDNLYAGWEERSFYKTSRSGFISVNLDKTLYNELR